MIRQGRLGASVHDRSDRIHFQHRHVEGLGHPRCRSLAAALAMVFELTGSALARRRAITTPRPVALVRNGARFERGVLVEREQAVAA